jgi:hypothetical protein
MAHTSRAEQSGVVSAPSLIPLAAEKQEPVGRSTGGQQEAIGVLHTWPFTHASHSAL